MTADTVFCQVYSFNFYRKNFLQVFRSIVKLNVLISQLKDKQ
jgi:hypothetical protein